MSRVAIDVRGLPAVKKMLASVDDRERLNRERRGVRAAGNAFKGPLSAAAAAAHGGSGNVPASFRKVRVRVSMSNRRGRQPTAIIRPASPLFNIFEPGAGAHTIAPSRGTLAGPIGGSGWTADGRKRRRGFGARGPVRHPGMRARPLLPGVFAANSDRAADAAAEIIFGTSIGTVLGGPE